MGSQSFPSTTVNLHLSLLTTKPSAAPSSLCRLRALFSVIRYAEARLFEKGMSFKNRLIPKVAGQPR